MTEFLASYNLLGLVIGLSTFVVIGLFHPLVIKGEYYFGTGCWRWFLLAGIAFGILSLMTDDVLLSSVSGVVAFSSLWSIKEVFEQRERVARGWFPANPRRSQSRQQPTKKATS